MFPLRALLCTCHHTSSNAGSGVFCCAFVTAPLSPCHSDADARRDGRGSVVSEKSTPGLCSCLVTLWFYPQAFLIYFSAGITSFKVLMFVQDNFMFVQENCYVCARSFHVCTRYGSCLYNSILYKHEIILYKHGIILYKCKGTSLVIIQCTTKFVLCI